MKHSAFTVLFPNKKLEEVFSLLAELNYDGVEVRVKEDYHVPPEAVRSHVQRLEELGERYKLEIPVLATYLSITDQEALFPIFEAADRLGAKGVRVSLGPSLDGRKPYWTLLPEVQRALDMFIKTLKPFKAKALFEIHFRTLISSPSLAYLLLKPFDPAKIGVIYDPGNMIIEGREDWKLGVGVVKNYLSHVHVKNASWVKEKRWIWRWDELKLGMADWEEIMGALLSINYDGYLSNENLCGVDLPGATGFVGERLSSGDKSPEPIEEKLAEDLRYLKELEKYLKGG